MSKGYAIAAGIWVVAAMMPWPTITPWNAMIDAGAWGCAVSLALLAIIHAINGTKS